MIDREVLSDAASQYFADDGPTVFHMTSSAYRLPFSHIHNHNELLFLVSGKLRLENNLKSAEVNAPAVILHNSYTLHRAELIDGYYERYVINFFDDAPDEIAGIRETVRFFKNANMTVIRLTEEMRDTMEAYVRRYPAMNAEDGSRNALTCMILCEIAKYRSPGNTVDLRAKIPYINDVMNELVSSYADPLTMEELAARFYVSRAKLAADFVTATGMTVKQYSTLVRMNVAGGIGQNGHISEPRIDRDETAKPRSGAAAKTTADFDGRCRKFMGKHDLPAFRS